jgi:hypothetical protein
LTGVHLAWSAARPQPPRRAEGTPFRIPVAVDFRGSAEREANLGHGRTIAVDVGNLETVLTRMPPTLELPA